MVIKVINIKRLFPFFLFIVGLQARGQQSAIQGVVSIHNSQWKTGKRQYVTNAQVEDDFKKAQPQLTNNKGEFVLIYVGIANNAPVSFHVKKEGLQVVNIDALSAVAGQQEVLRISMASPEKIAEYRQEIYEIGKSEAQKKLEELLRKKAGEMILLRKDSERNVIRINQLASEVTLLEEQRKKIEEQAQNLARQYAPVNLDDAAPLFRAAFSYFQSGYLDSALQLLRQSNLPEKVSAVILEKQKIEHLKNELSYRETIENKQEKDITEALKLKANLHETAFQFDSAAFCFKLLVKIDSLNEENLFEYARSLQRLNQYDTAINYYAKALQLVRFQAITNSQAYEPDIALIQNNLGILYRYKNDFFRAHAAFLEVLEIYTRLAKTNPHTYESDVATIQNNIGILYSDKNDFFRAQASYLEALEIYRRLAKTNPQSYESNVAATQNNVGILYKNKNDFVRAEASYLEALEINRRLAKTNPQTYESDLAMTQNNLGNLYRDENDLAKAEASYLEALEIYRQLAKTNPQTYEFDVAATQNNLGVLYKDKKDFAKAEGTFLEALEIRRRLAKTNPQAYESDVAMTQNNLGNLYSEENDFVRTEAFYLEALEIYRRLTKTNPQTYESEIAVIQNNLGILYSNKNDFVKAEAAYLEALEIKRRLAKTNPQAYEPGIATTQNNLGYLYYLNKHFKQSEIYLTEAFIRYENLMNLYSNVYLTLTAQTAINLLDLYITVRDTTSTVLNKALLPRKWEILNDKLYNLAKINKNVATKYALYYGNYSWYALLARKFKEAELASLKAYDTDNSQLWIKTNLAHALLFQNKYMEALQIYKELKLLRDKEGKSYEVICLEDLDELEKQGIINEHVNKVRQFLRQ